MCVRISRLGCAGLLASLAFVAGCSIKSNSPTYVLTTSHDEGMKHDEVAKDSTPVQRMNMYLDGVHFYADDLGRQIEAHHYCMPAGEGVFQCTIFDTNGEGAKLIGVEYIITEANFLALPEDEKKLWHSHHYEIKSGALLLPGSSDEDETKALAGFMTTYGKTFHTWQVDRGDKIPLGVPQLMMALTKDGQLDMKIIEERDKRMNVSTAHKRKIREGIADVTIQPGANSWEDGETYQLKAESTKVKNMK